MQAAAAVTGRGVRVKMGHLLELDITCVCVSSFQLLYLCLCFIYCWHMCVI